MPARRELHTGRYNFLHRGWGPLEPFDDSMPEILKDHGIYTHFVTDHQHYWEDGGCTYHTRYSSFDISRGQEGDPWKAYSEGIKAVGQMKLSNLSDRMHCHDDMNRKYIDCEEKMPQSVTFKGGLEFIENNHKEDNWFLQIETFDPHEPFFSQQEYKKSYPHEYDGEMSDWPPYYFVQEGDDAVEHVKMEYAALMTMCDQYLGKVLDMMDRYNLWEDTLLIVNTDHGYLIGEHGWWSKTVMPLYEEIARTPLFIYNPKSKVRGERRNVITQIIDIPATILDFFNRPIPKDMQGSSLLPVIEDNIKVRDYALFGYHEGHINITDGEWVYMLAPDYKKSLFEYTLMPTHMRSMFQPQELQNIKLQEPFSFTKGCRLMKIQAGDGMVDAGNYGTRLYNIKDDPLQKKLLENPEKEAELINAMIKLMKECDCPMERFERFHIPDERIMTSQMVKERYEEMELIRQPEVLKDCRWDKGAVNMYHALTRMMLEEAHDKADRELEMIVQNQHVKEKDILILLGKIIPDAQQEVARYSVLLNSRTE